MKSVATKSNHPKNHMRNLFPLLFLFLLASCQQEEFNPELTRTFTIPSVITGASYPISVALPEHYSASEAYSTIYVLDGEDNFSYVANTCRERSAVYGTSNLIVVAIGYGHDRSFDYTPTKADHDGGGAEQFVQFIKEELIPVMEAEYGADTARASRIILGHSFGGLCAAYAFTHFNNVFGHYLMLSPSLWYDNEILLRLEREGRDNNQSADQLVFMGLGSVESNGRMMAPFEAFYQRLDNHYPSMHLAKHIEPQLDHMGSRDPNILQGLNFYFQNR